jgi:hypothetical protein
MQPEALPRSLSPQANNLNSTQEATFLQTNSLVESVDNHLLLKYSPELVIFSIDDSSIISVFYPVSESVPRLYILTVRGLNVFKRVSRDGCPRAGSDTFQCRSGSDF